ncbi:hypothetical protein J6590_080997 [Homalodisca vitripennis]|nr:hypothetical protein J6590_080997 [Homalodisca vitripennis]
MRAVSKSLSIVAQVQGIGEGAVYDSERWMVRRPEEEFRAAARAAWEEIRGILADFLYETATRMEEDSRRRNTAAPSNGLTPATQPREVSCPVCFANLPTNALRQCGHTLCRPCSNRVRDRCPTCRELIVGRFTIYLPRSTSTQSSPHHTIRYDSSLFLVCNVNPIFITRETKKVRLGSPVPALFTIEVMFPCSRQLGAAILNTRESEVMFPCSRQFFPPIHGRRHIGIPSVPRFSLT